MTKPRDDEQSLLTLCWAVFVAALAGSGLGACGVAMYFEWQATGTVDLKPVYDRLDRQEVWQRQALGALGTVQQNQQTMWSNGVVTLHRKTDLLVKAQIKAGRLKVGKKEPQDRE